MKKHVEIETEKCYDCKKKNGCEFTMLLEIIHDKMTDLQVDVDAVVLAVGAESESFEGVAAAVYQQAGPGLTAARKQIGRMEVGQASITMGYDLDSIYVIHTVAPAWQGGDQGEEELLLACYRNCLELAVTHNCRSVAFPLLSAEGAAFPKEVAEQIARKAFEELSEEQKIEIFLVLP